jgi:hypothetical protein
MRRVFIVLSSKSLPYAHACIRTMLGNCAEPISLHLIADDTEEQRILVAETAAYARPGRAVISVISEEEVADRIADRFPGLEGLRALHQGHPCWRKIIDPLALSAPEEEIIVADPDLFFPNRFDFEPMPQQGVLMMRQGPNCLYPPAAVRAAFDHGLRLANHVDIGVAQVRAGTIDPEWLDWAVRPLVQSQLSSFMHIEAIRAGHAVWRPASSAQGLALLGTRPDQARGCRIGVAGALGAAAGAAGAYKMHPCKRPLEMVGPAGPEDGGHPRVWR